METDYVSPSNCGYSAIKSFLEIRESSSEIIILDDAQFEFPPYDALMDEIFQQSENSTENSISAPQHSAFSAYIKVHSNAVADYVVSSETLHKKCFRFLGKMDQDRKLKIQGSSPTAHAPAPAANNNQELNAKNKNRGKSAFHHMIAERNRRVKLNDHFQNLCSLLPRNCRKDKHSILANATSYLRELKLRAAKLEQQNERVGKSIPVNFSNNGGSSRFESHEESLNLGSQLLYHSVDVILEQCKDIPCKVRIVINVQLKMVSFPENLLLKVIELLRAEQLEILSLSHTKGFGFQAIFMVLPKGEDWDISHWQTFGSLLTRTLN